MTNPSFLWWQEVVLYPKTKYFEILLPSSTKKLSSVLNQETTTKWLVSSQIIIITHFVLLDHLRCPADVILNH